MAQALGIYDKMEPLINGMTDWPSGDKLCHGDFWLNAIMIDFDKNVYWVLDWEMARYDVKQADFQHMCLFTNTFRGISSVFSRRRVDHYLKRLSYEFYGDEEVNFVSKYHDHFRKLYPLISMGVMGGFERGMGWKADNLREFVLSLLDESEKLNTQ